MRLAPPVGLMALSIPAIAQLVPSPTYNPPPAASGTVKSSSSPNPQWSNVLGNAFWFYDAQRSGNLDAGAYPNRVTWRNNSAMQDGSDWNLDLTGGWYDAGDYIKCLFPLSNTLFALSWGALTHGRGWDLAQQSAYLDSTLRWGFDWMMRAHPSDDVLFVQVGDSTIDNSYWGGDQNIPTPRPSYPINSSSPGTDAWASTAAAFAMASLLYTPGVSYVPISGASPPSSPSLGNSTYASELLSHAKTLYATANQTRPFSLFAHSIPAVASAYTATNYTDKLAMGALSLALATNESAYYADAYNFYQEFALTGSNDPWNWDSRYPALYVLFVEAAKTRPNLATGAGLAVNLTGWQTEAEGWFDRIVNGEDSKQHFMTPGGLLWFEGWSDESSLIEAMSASMLFYKYAPLASTSNKTSQYQEFAQNQVAYMLGNNPMSAVYLVGSHPNSPQNPHSAPASGGDNINAIRTQPPVEAHVLYGAMVGGPLQNDKFWDWRDDWVQTEVALDYNAVIPFLASWQLINDSPDPYYVNVTANTYYVPSGDPCDAALPCNGTGNGGLSDGAKAGIGIGVILGVGLIIAFIWYIRRDQIARWWRSGYVRPH